MDALNRSKRFGEILDTAFQLCRNHFSRFFMIILIMIGPFYLLEALILLMTGTSFFSEASPSGEGWFGQLVSSFEDAAVADEEENLLTTLAGLPAAIMTPVAFAAVLFGVDRLRNNGDFQRQAVMKQALSKFGPLLGGSILFGLIAFGMIMVGTFIITIFSLMAAVSSFTSAVIMIIILLLGIGLSVAYLLSRLAFFAGVAAYEDNAPGLGRSWNLTQGHSWKTLGIFLVFFLIFLIIQLGLEYIFFPFLGDSVLYILIISLTRLFTNTIFAVGYAVVYFDLKVRHDGDNLKDLIADYEKDNSQD